jgi:hypothetical protein
LSSGGLDEPDAIDGPVAEYLPEFRGDRQVSQVAGLGSRPFRQLRVDGSASAANKLPAHSDFAG